MEEKLFEEIDKHILEDDKPSIYMRKILSKLKGTNLEILLDLEKVQQNPTYHPEGNVLNHSLLVLDGAALVRKYAKDKRTLMWAAMLHDLGKKKATKVRKGRIVAYDHDKFGRKEAFSLLDKYEFLNDDFKNNVSTLVGYHMHGLYITRNLPFARVEDMIKDVEVHDILLLFFADKLGKGENSKEKIKSAIEQVKEIIKYIEDNYKIDLSKTVNDFNDLEKNL